MDKHDLYELCVQSPRHVAMFLRALHGAQPRVLREDFCGTAALSCRWIEDGLRAGVEARAVGVDLDPAVLERARRRVNGDDRIGPRLRLVTGDAVRMGVDPSDGCDVVFVGNFSIGYISDRATLVRYIQASRQRLNLGAAGWGGGVFVCDIYDGPNAYKEGAVTRMHTARGHEIVRYTWEQHDADLLSARVHNVLHFRVEIDGEVTQELSGAFEYHWRLWSIPELREAMSEAGFVRTEVHQIISDRPEAIEHGRDLGESGIACVVAWA